MNNLKIRTRLGIGFGVVLALLTVIVAISIDRLGESLLAAERAASYQDRAEKANAWMAKAELNATRALAMAKSGSSAAVQAEFGPLIAKATREIDVLQKDLAQSITSDAGKALLADAAAKRHAFVGARNAVTALVKEGDLAGAEVAVDQKMKPASAAHLAALTALQKFQQERAAASDADTRASLQRARLLLGGLLLLGLVIGVVMAASITRSVTQPLRLAVDEARAMAGLDLSRDIRSTRQDELGDLLRAFTDMQDALRRIVTQVRHATDSISTASVQIASGNLDLSSRTEQAASNLQQTASAIEQVSGTARHSADAARTANQLASSAAQVASHGGAVVSQVVTTMDEINTSSKKIADIIGVIDGIAFQTNILALNAAVEAARAGEQGRGFAVVASEVRSLAQRSADAAKEIKALIGASVDRVESGSKLVADAGSTMGEIVASVQRVADIIGEISAATAEQSDGIGQVNGAVTQLDQMTQQNAALVEQSASATESLKDQATTLATLMSSFHLAQAATARA